MTAAAIAQNAGHAGDQRGDQDDKPENNDHDDSTSRAAVRPAAGSQAPGSVLAHLKVNPGPRSAGNNRSAKGPSPQPITGHRARGAFAYGQPRQTGTAVACATQSGRRRESGVKTGIFAEHARFAEQGAPRRTFTGT